MKVVGIIAEYNPFHNGHQYQIEELKKQTKADYCIIAMSGNFLQRGVPALCSKFERTRMALSCGADLVLELPVLWATASAEYFAHGGVALLQNTGVVTHLGFGAETDDLTLLHTVSSILKEEPKTYTTALRQSLRQGNSYPTARKEALLAAFSNPHNVSVENVLELPNNILALEYLKFLPSEITPVLIQRKGAGYHDTSMDSPLPSASAIRSALSCANTSEVSSSLRTAMPLKSVAILEDCLRKNAFLDTSDFSEVLGYRLWTLYHSDFSHFADCNKELSNTICRNLNNYRDWDSFCTMLKSKNYTYTRISRTLLHILLNIQTEDLLRGSSEGYAPYLRVLGFRREAAELLSSIKKNSSVPLITKVADYPSYFNGETHFMMEMDLHASALYQQLLTTKKGLPPTNDYLCPLTIL